MEITKERIRSLDGLRCAAVLAVLAFHYGAMWPGLYPYGAALADTPVRWGYFGVHLFFVISGYVITLTLERCSSLYEFAARRVARLWPTMAFCSVLTYCIMTLAPGVFPTSATWFLPSLTFIAPEVWNTVLGTDLQWIDGAYWSLFSEVRFYALIGLLYFAGRKHFRRNVVAVSIAIIAAYCIAMHFNEAGAIRALVIFTIADDLPWFLLGIATYWNRKDLAGVAVAALLAYSILKQDVAFAVAALLIPAAIWITLHVDAVSRTLSTQWIANIGMSSYSLYLLHQYIGVTLISSATHGYVAAAVVTIGMIVMARFIFVYCESPANHWLLMRLTRRPGNLSHSSPTIRMTRD